MSALSFLSAFVAVAKTALADVKPYIPVVEGVANVVAGAIPAAAGPIAATEAAVNSIEAASDGAFDKASSLIAAGEGVIANVTPELQALDSWMGNTFHWHFLPTGMIVAIPKTTAATVPSAAPPGKALS